MSTIIVKNKEELERAYREKADKIIVQGEFAKKIKKVESIKKITPQKLAALGIASTVIGAGVATGPVTGGAGYAVSVVTATSISVSTGIAVSVIMLACTISITLLVSVFNDYETNVRFKGNGIEVELERKRNR